MKAKICLTEKGLKVFERAGIDPDSYGPSYNSESAALDLYNVGDRVFIPGRNNWNCTEPILVSTGVKVIIPNGFVGLILERGSIVKTGLSVRAGVIDPGFTGEIFVSFLNVGDRDTIIETGAKMPAQLVVVPCASSFERITDKEYERQTKHASRRQKMLGSTD